MRLFFSMLLCGTLFVSVLCRAADISIEHQIQKYVKDHQAAQINDLRNWVNINSGTNNIAGVHRVGNILQKQFKRLGFTTRWVEMPKALHRAGTLIAERKGSNGKKLLLIGHLDTVFPPEKAFKHFEQKKMLAKGPGVLDDKGGVAVILYALKALSAMNALQNVSITVVLTGDEEDSGKPTAISRKALLSAAQGKDIALDFEPAITLDTVTIARRGIDQWVLQTQGNESHSATIFEKGVGAGAIYELARVINEMRLQFQGEKYVSVNPGVALSGNHLTFDSAASTGDVFGKENVVAKNGLVRGDLRYLTQTQRQSIRTRMQTIASLHLPGSNSMLSFQDGIPAMPPSAANTDLMTKYSRVSAELGYGEIKSLDPGQRGAGDISFVDQLVPAKLAGLGPVGFGTHSIIETIDLSSLPIQTERAALFIYRLTH